MASDEADRIRTKAYVEAGLGNTVNPVALQKYGYEDYTSPQSKVWLQTNQSLFQHGHPEPYGENMSQIYNLLGVPLGEIEQNPNADPKALLDKSAREVDSKLTGYVAPQIMHTRRVWAWTIFGLLLAALLAFLGWQGKRWQGERARRTAMQTHMTRPAGLPPTTQMLAWAVHAARCSVHSGLALLSARRRAGDGVPELSYSGRGDFYWPGQLY